MNDILTMRTELANDLAVAGAKLLSFTATAGALAAIPETEPQQYVVAGTMESILAVLPTEATPARRKDDRHPTEPLTWDEGTDRTEVARPAATSGDAPTDPVRMTNEEIDIIWQTMPGGPGAWLKGFGYQQFAKAIEDEVILNQQREPAARIESAAAPTATPAPNGLREFGLKVGYEISSWIDANDPLPDVEAIVDQMLAATPAAQDQAECGMCHGEEGAEGASGVWMACPNCDGTGLEPAASADAVVEATPEMPEECWSRDEEDFNHQSLADLVGTFEDLKPGDTVWVGEAVRPDPSQLVNVDGILENMGEAAYDMAGEYAEDYPEVSKAHADELESLIAAWIARTCPPNFWTVANIKPYVLSADDFPNDPTPLVAESGVLRTGEGADRG